MVLSKVKIIIVILLIISMSELRAQYDESVVQAFSKSYASESKNEYKTALAAMKPVYTTDSYEINIRMAWLEYKSELYAESVAHYKRAAELHPYSVEALLGLSYPLSAQSEWTKLAEVYSKVLVIDPKNSTANYQLGLIYYYSKEYNTALYYFLKVAELYPFDYNSNLICGWSYYLLGKNREAKVFFTKALYYNPSNTEISELVKKM